MSTHADWDRARTVRNQAAVRVARAVLAQNSPSGRDLADFAKADSDMERIDAELSGDLT